jgi:protein-disulfide isomerase
VRAEKFKVNGTPTFFANGRRLTGERSIEEFHNVVEPLSK